MEFLFASLSAAAGLLTSGDPEVTGIVWTSLWISSTATLLAALLGVPLGVAVAVGRFPGRGAVLLLLNTLMALPTVVVGLFVYGLISRQGPLGEWGLLFTPAGVIMGQCLLALPIIANLTVSAIEGLDPRLALTCKTLGAGLARRMLAMLSEGRAAVMAAVIAGFGRVIAEVGVAMMLGGNIRWYTRTMTTAVALETSKGEFVLGLALGIALLVVAFGVNAALFALQRRGT
ncbi:MAG: ABC transporter permease [Nitrospirota bacterium]|nr:ABC transporter permease [Nitrospirota bacterium]